MAFQFPLQKDTTEFFASGGKTASESDAAKVSIENLGSSIDGPQPALWLLFAPIGK